MANLIRAFTAPVATVVLVAIVIVQARADDKEKQTKKPKPKFTIGKDTTRVTGPVDKEGYINYEAAINDIMSKGVTPETNSMVPLYQAFGPKPLGTPMPVAFFKRLGIPTPPDQGDYFIGVGQFAKNVLKLTGREANDEFFNEQDHASRRVWKAADHPRVAEWLKANDKPLALIIEASKRKDYYSPIVTSQSNGEEHGDLIGALLPGVQKLREVASALTARAMLRAGEGQYDDAWRDLLACHRLARLAGRGPTLIESLVAIAIDAKAGLADQTLIESPKLDAARLKKYLRDLQQLPPVTLIADKIDLGERFMYLDSAMMMMRHGTKYLEGLAGGPAGQGLGALAAEGFANWDPALRRANQWYDKMAAALRGKDRAARMKKLDDIERELKDLKTKHADTQKLAKRFEKDADARGEVLGDMLIGLLMPAVEKVQAAADRSEQTQRNLQLAFALAIYQRENGKYPATLGELAPKYVAKVPDDLFTGKPLVYQSSEKGYLLYSLGPNGKDDAGRGPDDDPKGDDLSVRMPLPKLRDKADK